MGRISHPAEELIQPRFHLQAAVPTLEQQLFYALKSRRPENGTAARIICFDEGGSHERTLHAGIRTVVVDGLEVLGLNTVP